MENGNPTIDNGNPTIDNKNRTIDNVNPGIDNVNRTNGGRRLYKVGIGGRTMSESEGNHMFPKGAILLKDLLPLIRMSGYDHRDEGGTTIRLCPECEEWTHVRFNENSCFLDLLGDLLVESLDADGGEIVLWIKTDDYNWFNIGG